MYSWTDQPRNHADYQIRLPQIDQSVKAIIISILVTIAVFIFGTKPLVRAVGGSAKLWAILVFDIIIGALTYALLKA